jgi:hypothetical protein
MAATSKYPNPYHHDYLVISWQAGEMIHLKKRFIMKDDVGLTGTLCMIDLKGLPVWTVLPVSVE